MRLIVGGGRGDTWLMITGLGAASSSTVPASTGFLSYAGFGRFTITSEGFLSADGGWFANTVVLNRATEAMRAARCFRLAIREA